MNLFLIKMDSPKQQRPKLPQQQQQPQRSFLSRIISLNQSISLFMILFVFEALGFEQEAVQKGMKFF